MIYKSSVITEFITITKFSRLKSILCLLVLEKISTYTGCIIKNHLISKGF